MIDYILENSADPDEMLHRAAFHLGRHCLQNTRSGQHDYILFQARNPTYVFIQLAQCAKGMIIFGVSTFSFKYLLEMYDLSFDKAGNIFGKLFVHIKI